MKNAAKTPRLSAESIKLLRATAEAEREIGELKVASALDTLLDWHEQRMPPAAGNDNLRDPIAVERQLLVDAAQFLDAWKSGDPASWTAFDQTIRDRISAALVGRVSPPAAELFSQDGTRLIRKSGAEQ